MQRLRWWEWMVVGLTLVVLGAVFMPVTANQDRNGVGTQCISRLKQMALGHFIYGADYDDRFPNRDNWMDSILPYVKNVEITRCPELSKAKDPQVYGYCFNRRLSNAKIPQDPEKVALAFDSINLAKNASGTLESLPRPGRHSGNNAIAYADGHAKAGEYK